MEILEIFLDKYFTAFFKYLGAAVKFAFLFKRKNYTDLLKEESAIQLGAFVLSLPFSIVLIYWIYLN